MLNSPSVSILLHPISKNTPMRKQYAILVLTLLVIFTKLAGQDSHFSQFYASPLYLNPGLTGAFDGKYRISTIYRDQGRNLLDEPYTTFSAAADFRFDVGTKGKDAVGLGMIFLNDRSASVNFYTNTIGVSGAYHKALNRYGDQYLSLGVQFGIGQRNINYENLSFEDQFNGQDGYTDPTAEVYPFNNFGYGDIAVGLNYTYAPGDKLAVFAGAAMHHVLEPQVSFYAKEEVEERRNDNQLFRKYSAYVNLQYPINNRVQFSPRILGYIQGPHLTINAGGNFRFLLDDIEGTALHVGGWVRPVRNFTNKFVPDAVILMTGIEYNNFLIGVSYDARLGNLASSGRRLGALEISLAFLGNYDNETVLCPKF